MTEQKLTELLRHAYYCGRDNGSNRSDKNFNDFLQTEAAKRVLSIANVAGKNGHLCEHDYQSDTTCGVDITVCSKCGDVI